jgi:hypothetical protein
MKLLFAIVLLALMPVVTFAQTSGEGMPVAIFQPVENRDLSQFLWTNRVIIVFSDTPADPRYAEQIKLLREGIDMLEERDVVILTDTDLAANSPIRQKLRPRGFAMVLVDKDGGVKLRKPAPWTVREITRSIDKTPMRQREVEERRGE